RSRISRWHGPSHIVFIDTSPGTTPERRTLNAKRAKRPKKQRVLCELRGLCVHRRGPQRTATIKLQHVTAPSAFATSLASTACTLSPRRARRSAVRGNADDTTIRSWSRSAFAAGGSDGSTSTSVNPLNTAGSTHFGFTSRTSSLKAVTADFKCRHERTTVSRTV